MPNVLTARRTAAVNRLRGVSQNWRLRPGAERALGAAASGVSRTGESTYRMHGEIYRATAPRSMSSTERRAKLFDDSPEVDWSTRA